MADGVASSRIYVRALGATGGDEAPDRVDLAVMGGNAALARQCDRAGCRHQEPIAVTRPKVFLIRMAVFLVLVVAVAATLSPVLLTAYANNPALNSLILVVLLIGIGWNLRQVLRLTPEVAWLETFQTARAAARRRCPRRNCWRRWPTCWPRARRRAAPTRPASPSPPRRCAACSTASPRGSTRAASCRAT